jgi:hypothetical protein
MGFVGIVRQADIPAAVLAGHEDPARGLPGSKAGLDLNRDRRGETTMGREMFLKFWEKEAATTRNVLARIPEGIEYRPDPKSRTAREIAWLIVRVHVALVEGFEKGVLEWTEVPAPATMKEILAAYDRENLVQRLQAVDSARWEGRVPFMMGGQQVMNETACDNAF